MSSSTKKPATNSSTDSSLTVGLVVDDSLDFPDGVQQYVLTLGSWLTRQGHTVHYIASTTKRTDIANLHQLARNKTVSYNKNQLRTPLPVSKSNLIELFEHVQFDILHVQAPYSPVFTGKILRKLPDTCAAVATFHIAPFSRREAAAAKLLGKASQGSRRHISAVCAVSPAADGLAYHSGYRVDCIIPNGVAVNHFAAAKPRGKTQRPLVITFLGRLVERKGCLQLLHAVQHIHSADLLTKPFIVRIGGRGPERTMLEQYVSKHNLSSIVQFDDFIDERDKPEYLASADIVVLPSISGESFGISVVEAMATGNSVVIAGDNPGYRGVMADNDEQLVDPHDSKRLAELIVKYTEPSARQRALKWQASIVDNYAIKTVGPQVLDLYELARSRRQTT
jgi:phosphatidyl-myo-inositol alpha-mannosyltransferase